ncbi:MAG: 5-methyltetrahydropteroyltriglutamate--homocysteine S-methyltransferase [Alphaproteobacteria bacterium]
MVQTVSLGFPRMGLRRELKFALEKFWSKEIDETALQQTAKELRLRHWQLQQQAGVSFIPSNDFSFYDQVLDTALALCAVPPEYGWHIGEPVGLNLYFSLARGAQTKKHDAEHKHDGCGGCSGHGLDVQALEMTKWFDTNYHYLVPELLPAQQFAYSSRKAVNEYKEAKEAGIETRPVILGPVTFLLLAKGRTENGKTAEPLNLLPQLLPVYAEWLKDLAAAGARNIQIDEPALVLNLSAAAKAAYAEAYAFLAKAVPELTLHLTSYFGALKDNLAVAVQLPVASLHVDLVRGAGQLDEVLAAIPSSLSLSLGVVDGRNIWKNDLKASIALVEKAVAKLGKERVLLGSSCSLLHVPVDLAAETKLDAELKSWLAFATQKLQEIAVIAQALDQPSAVADILAANAAAHQSRAASPRIHHQAVKQRLAAIKPEDAKRAKPFAQRRALQQQHLPLPAFPTTTIGSFPQTAEIRKARAANRKGYLSAADYNDYLRRETANAIKWQEEIGIDVLVHGEFERNDMVEYFGELLSGFAFTENGWVQSYGSRCVKPPIIFGDVSREQPMTVEWSAYAQSLTSKPMKGMLTGPVTILQWSFVRNDQPRKDTCQQIALALRDEVVDLEKAGINIIQIDEPAIREGLPLRREDTAAYLAWAVEAFRLSSSGVADTTQIHTHMCYSEFNDIIQAIADLDADVISIETARSKMELLHAFANFHYPNDIGPGVYDIHSPRIPSVEEMEALIKEAVKSIPARQLWVNPDCGLKTRRWEEVKPALQQMVEAAKHLRVAIKVEQAA